MREKMIKKIIGFILIFISVANALEYKDETKFTSIDKRFFIGGDVGFAYNRNDRFDDTYYTYGLYAGFPIYGYEVIYKKKLQRSRTYDGWLQSISFNIPLAGKSSRQEYFGLVAGIADLSFTDSQVSKKSLLDKRHDGRFYGAHIGKRYKLQRNLFSRIELEYLNYGFNVYNTSGDSYDVEDSLEFLMGIEYRF
jgi:hypothetical protein